LNSSYFRAAHYDELQTVATYIVTDGPIALGYSPDSQRLPR